MTVKRKSPGEAISILGNTADQEPRITELEFSQLISRVREDNDLPDDFIEAILISLGEVEAAKLLEYMFE